MPRHPSPDFESKFLDLLTDELKDVKTQMRQGFNKADRTMAALAEELHTNTQETRSINSRVYKVEKKVFGDNGEVWWKNKPLLTIVGTIIILT